MSLRRVKPSQSQEEVRFSDLEDQILSSQIPSLSWEIKGCDLEGRLMDLMWWERGGFGGRLGILLGNERERLNTPTIVGLRECFEDLKVK